MLRTNNNTKIKKSRTLIPWALLTALIIFGVYGSSQVMAEQTSDYPPIVQKIAEKFGLKEADVNEVFLQERADMWEKRKDALSDRLEQAVKDGKITEDQRQKILEKRDEIEAERTAGRSQFRQEMREWMKDNGINVNTLMPYFGFGGSIREGFHHDHMMN